MRAIGRSGDGVLSAKCGASRSCLSTDHAPVFEPSIRTSTISGERNLAKTNFGFQKRQKELEKKRKKEEKLKKRQERSAVPPADGTAPPAPETSEPV